jgi:ABC-type polysaccharide/polyol phosphate transport system ATPase subunit
MGDSSIVVEGVGKRFELHQARVGSFRELLARRRAGAVRPEKEFWALENIGFTVEPGHPLAIIGHNGSGKSTLLKLLTGILKPTRGKIDVHGRIGALIEVGAGFHPDLTGRENVYLNGSILGATRKEIDRHFDHIVAFAGLEKFIDTPVKRYSSGMHMRLGFSIAAHLEPEILLIDEVLAVGDAQFQTRCIGHLKRFVAQGGSVVFVSHAMGQVEALCDRVLWLDHGKALGFGEAAPLIEQYEALVADREDGEMQKLYPEEWAARKQEQEEKEARAERLTRLLEQRDTARTRRSAVRAAREAKRREDEETQARQQEAARLRQAEQWQQELERLAAFEAALEATRLIKITTRPALGRILSVTLTGERGQSDVFSPGERLDATIDYEFSVPFPQPAFGLDFFRADGNHVFTTSNFDAGIRLGERVGTGQVSLTLRSLCLPAGQYQVQANVYPDMDSPGWTECKEHELRDAVCFVVRAERPTPGVAWMPVENWR